MFTKGNPAQKILMVQYLPMQVQLGISHPMIYYVHIFNLMNTIVPLGLLFSLKMFAVQVLVLRLMYNAKQKLKSCG